MGVYDPTGAPRIGKAKKVAKKPLPAFMQKNVKKAVAAKTVAKKATPTKKGMK